MSVGSKPVEPKKTEKTELERVQHELAKSRQADFERRYLPVEQLLRDRTEVLGSDQAYARSMSAGQSAMAQSVGNAAKNAALLRAMGRGSGFTDIAPAAYSAIAQQEGAQRGNWLQQTTGVAGLGAGIGSAALGAYNSAVGFDRQAANRAYADAVSQNMAAAAQRQATLDAIGNTAVKVGTMYFTGGFGSAGAGSGAGTTGTTGGIR